MSVVRLILQIILVIVSIGLIVLVLLQSGKSAGLGASFGSNAVATGARGRKVSREVKLQKYTKICAIVVGVLAILMTVLPAA